MVARPELEDTVEPSLILNLRNAADALCDDFTPIDESNVGRPVEPVNLSFIEEFQLTSEGSLSNLLDPLWRDLVDRAAISARRGCTCRVSGHDRHRRTSK